MSLCTFNLARIDIVYKNRKKTRPTNLQVIAEKNNLIIAISLKINQWKYTLQYFNGMLSIISMPILGKKYCCDMHDFVSDPLCCGYQCDLELVALSCRFLHTQVLIHNSHKQTRRAWETNRLN